MLPVRSRGFVPIVVLVAGAVLALATVGGVVYYVSVYSPSEASTPNNKRVVALNIPSPQPGETQQLAQQSIQTETQTQAMPSPFPSPSPVTDQLTYISAEAGYTFKYPLGWSLIEGSSACGVVLYPPDTEKISLTICGLNAGSDDSPVEMAERSLGSNLSSLVSTKNITVDKHSAVRQETSITSGQYEIDVFVGDVSSKSKTLTGTLAIYFSIQDASKIESMKKQFETILSSFKFDKS